MSEDTSAESTAKSDAAAARRAAYERGEITGARRAMDGPEEQRSQWDTSLNTSTTPHSAIDNWGAQGSPAASESETSGSPDPDSSDGATASDTPEK